MEIDQPTKELLDIMGFIEDENKPGDFRIEIENGDAHVDFRKENGRRWARANGQFVKDVDTIPILKSFKEERDKLQSLSADLLELAKNRTSAQPISVPKEIIGTPDNLKDVEQKTNSKIIPPTTGASMPSAPTCIYKQLIEDWEIDSAVFYGTSGACKTKLAVFLALEAKADNKKVLFFDAEKNLRKAEVMALGDSYKFIPTMNGLIKAAENIPQDIDIVFCDSIGYHAYVTFCRADADAKQSKGKDIDQESGAGTNMKGKALLEVGAVSGILKNWAMNNNKIAIMTNQADSPFGKGKDYWPESFADKASHTMKEEMVLIKVKKDIGLTRSMIKTNKSRSAGKGVDVAIIDITDTGTTLRYFCKGKGEIKKTLVTEMKFI